MNIIHLLERFSKCIKNILCGKINENEKFDNIRKEQKNDMTLIKLMIYNIYG